MDNQIRELITKHGGLSVDVATLGLDADLYDAGLSSFASVQLMLGLEDRFDIEFPETMLNRRTFASIASIRAALAQLVDASEAA
jgi:Acyl carrier protein